MYKVKLTKAAKSDLKNAAFYIAYDLKNEAAANRLLDETDKQLSALCDMPEESKSITVLRFLHSRRDWASILTDEIIDNL